MAITVANLVRAGMWKAQADVIVAGGYDADDLVKVGFSKRQADVIVTLGAVDTLTSAGIPKVMADALKE